MTATLTYNSVQTSGGLHAPVVTAPVTVTGGVIDLSLGNYYQAAVSGDTTFTLSNVPSGNVAFTLEITYTSGVITWFNQVPYTILWSNGIAPIPTTGTITYTFILQDGDTYWKAIASEVYAPPSVAASPVTLDLVAVRYDVNTATITLPTGTQAGDLVVYFDHPNSATSSSVLGGANTPTSAGGSWTSLGGTNNASADSTVAYMWFRVVNAADISSGVITGRNNATDMSKSAATFRISSGSITTATVGIAGGLTDIGADNPVAITSSSASTNQIVLALMLVSATSNGTVAATTTASIYSETIIDPSNDIAGSFTTTAVQHGAWKIISKDKTKYDVTFTHSGFGNYASTVRNYIVVT